MPNRTPTSWESVEHWYSSCVGEKGHYYHRSVILPGTLRLLRVQNSSSFSILDMGCGPGVLARSLPTSCIYYGVDVSPSLIAKAKNSTGTTFFVADATKDLPFEKRDFDYVAFILSLQNMENPEEALSQAALRLKKGGRLLLVLNHPCFRIPRQSSWGVDEKNQLVYRRINRYLSPLKIPIQMHPGRNEGTTTFSFHRSLSSYMDLLFSKGFVVTALEEWTSDKQSEGTHARRENRARAEIPLFLALLAESRQKISGSDTLHRK